MIRVYIDWNVMSQMKGGVHAELLSILSNNDKFHKLYSTAHIGDIFGQGQGDEVYTEHVNSDLDFISSFTDDCCIFTNGNEVKVEPYDPHSLYEQRKFTQNIGRFDITEDINNPQVAELLKTGYNTLMNFSLKEVLKDAFVSEQSTERMDKMYPGLRDNQTMGGMIEAVCQMFQNMNDSTTYKDLRANAQQGMAINRDQMFDSKDPIAQIEKIYQKSGRKLSLKEFTHVPKWYGDILNWYLLLDMYGYQEDSVRTDKGRKETFRNTTNDAFHAAFASTCDFYIINDKKAFKKTSAVYRKLELNTVVIKPDDFVKYYHSYLAIGEPLDHLKLMLQVFRHEPDRVLEEGGSILKSFYFPYFIWNMFTRGHISYNAQSEEPLVFLSKDKPSNGRWTYRMEIEKLVDMLNAVLGQDAEGFGQYDPDREDFTNEWQGRRWVLDVVTFRLTFPNGWIQLYMDYN